MEMMEADKASYHLHHPLRPHHPHQSPVASYPSLSSPLSQLPPLTPSPLLTSSPLSEAASPSRPQLLPAASYLSQLFITQQQLLLRREQLAADLDPKHDILALDQMKELETALVSVAAADDSRQRRAQVCEAAARLLFLNSRWASQLPSFSALAPALQVELLASCWKELFLLGCAQFLAPNDVADLIDAAEGGDDSCQMAELKAAVTLLAGLELDAREYGQLRLALLLPGRAEQLLLLAGGGGGMRLAGLLLQLLPRLAAVPAAAIQELFFKTAVGSEVAIDRIVIDMFRKETH